MRLWVVVALASCYSPELDAPLQDVPVVDAALADAPLPDVSGSASQCSAPEDCPGQECCAASLPIGGSSCQDVCPSGTAEVCNQLEDCACGPCDSCGDDPDPGQPNYALPVCYDN